MGGYRETSARILSLPPNHNLTFDVVLSVHFAEAVGQRDRESWCHGTAGKSRAKDAEL